MLSSTQTDPDTDPQGPDNSICQGQSALASTSRVYWGPKLPPSKMDMAQYSRSRVVRNLWGNGEHAQTCRKLSPVDLLGPQLE